MSANRGRGHLPRGSPPGWRQRIFGTRNPKEWLNNPIGILNRSAQRAGAAFGGNVAYAGGARYFAKGLDEVLEGYVGSASLPSALTDVIVTSYDLANDEPVLFSSRPRPGCISDVEMRIVARATSAGPTYFEPQPVVEAGKQRVLVDGGVYINNPALLAYVMGASKAADRPIALVSLGTGTRNPAAPRSLEQIKTANWIEVVRMVMEAAMTGGGELADMTLSNLLAGSARYGGSRPLSGHVTSQWTTHRWPT
jgi:patatin-like phospholipase/acyl hydrolase